MSVQIEQLKEAMELGAVRERDRIIALLEKHEQIHDWEHSYCSCDPSECDYGIHILALIKGEN